MKRIILSAIALSVLAVPVAQAQQGSSRGNDYRIEQRQDRSAVGGHTYRKPDLRKPRFERGHRFTTWKQHRELRDWQRYGLRKPGQGQRWIRVGNDFLLISIASGVIAGIIAGR
jgi:Ni/Co efflux regulator RcnB